MCEVLQKLNLCLNGCLPSTVCFLNPSTRRKSFVYLELVIFKNCEVSGIYVNVRCSTKIKLVTFEVTVVKSFSQIYFLQQNLKNSTKASCNYLRIS